MLAIKRIYTLKKKQNKTREPDHKLNLKNTFVVYLIYLNSLITAQLIVYLQSPKLVLPNPNTGLVHLQYRNPKSNLHLTVLEESLLNKTNLLKLI